MQMNRRNVIVGLGTIVAGGGAALGSGAFSQTAASRDLEVNVVTDSDIAAEFVDIVLRGVDDIDSVAVDGEDATSQFPDSGDDYGNSDFEPSDSDVSLMQNDVTIVFGPEGNALPPNSTIEYDDLITVVNDEGDVEQNFQVTFEVTGGTDLTFSPSESTVEVNETQDIDVDVNTSDQDTSSGTLTITIEEQN
ncbi:hypothetical protein [Natrialba sp. INN-245]|uniref:hypothetical protein n=1 Tax=Natrialba sp. INN-245 TaxID=2690967 RepID=UPI001310FC68|nr:hypothetical protein [Natrialba sp. INN-245]MWV40343.1 hypothetical protein [Natrialba sp. INN-245]